MRHDERPPLPGVHGGDAELIAGYLGVEPAEILDLSASLNPFAPTLRPIVERAVDRIGRYPDPSGATRCLAEALGVDPGRLVITNGGAEAIALVAQIESVGWVESPEFALYARHLRTIDSAAPRWRSNPSNPVGRLAAPEETAGVWDEAFWPLSTGTWTRGDDASWRLGSLTKIWACPGLRIGYVIAPDADSAEALRAVQPRWSVNALALAVIEPLLSMTDLPKWQAAIAARRQEFAEQLRQRNLVVDETETCWILVKHKDLRSMLIPTGVLVRDCASFGLEATARLALPDDDGMERILNALDQVLA